MTTREKFRAARGSLTQEQAAAAIGCPVATYRDWEQGRREPPAWIRKLAIGKLANATGTKPVETWDGCKTQADIEEYLRQENA
jgi:DNA-binding XRE family transcriptional regulator